MFIQLTQGYSTEVDDSDYEWLSSFKWHFKNGYARRQIGPVDNKKEVWIHTLIMKVDKGVDHIDRNGLNNKRSNLRMASNSLQGHNRLMPKRILPRGVSEHVGKFQASIRIDHHLVYLGRYETPEEASYVYREAAFKHHGEYPPE